MIYDAHNDLIYRTYEGWKVLGYHVVKGEKSTRRDKAGVCVFSEAQVLENAQFNNPIPQDIHEVGLEPVFGLYGNQD